MALMGTGGEEEEEGGEEEEEKVGRGGRRGCKGRDWGSGREAVMRAWAAVREEGERGGSISRLHAPIVLVFFLFFLRRAEFLVLVS